MSANALGQLQRVNEKGWRRGLSNLLQGEYSAWFRSSRWWNQLTMWIVIRRQPPPPAPASRAEVPPVARPPEPAPAPAPQQRPAAVVPIKEAASASGFRRSGGLAQAFRRHVGVSPGENRRIFAAR